VIIGIYYQNNIFDYGGRNMQTGKVVSGFVIEGSVKICVVYGMSCCGREMILIGTQRVNKGRGKKVLGLA
jgi:hypothetical protein